MLSYFSNPRNFMRLSSWLLPIFSVLGLAMLLSGWFWALFYVPEEQYQGATARIMFVHVPAAWVSLLSYAFMAVASFIYLIMRHSLADVAAKSAAPVAAAFAFICLATGSLWGRPTWGTYWIWDARLTSMLFQLFLILGYMALRAAYQRQAAGAQAAAILCLVGAINLPIIKFSVDWWNTLHQPASFMKMGGSGLAPEYLWPLLYNAIGASFVFGAILLALMRADVFQRRYDTALARLNRSGS